MAKNICIIAGARPNFVKVSPLVRAIGQRQDAECLMVYAGRCRVRSSIWVSTARASMRSRAA